MKIIWYDKLKTLVLSYIALLRAPFRYVRYSLLSPIESTRYHEFSYLLKKLKSLNLGQRSKILDVSSPYLMAYMLSNDNEVIKTDINEKEKFFIKESDNLHFNLQDATQLSFPDNYFDFVYSISVIEHIYQKSKKALQEMIRVAKPGAFIYITIPVSRDPKEDWIDLDIYSNQYKEKNKVFFQHQFDEKMVEGLLSGLDGATVISKEFYWGKNKSGYDDMTFQMRKDTKNRIVNNLRRSFLNYYYGFSLLKSYPENFGNTSNYFGVACIFIKKI